MYKICYLEIDDDARKEILAAIETTVPTPTLSQNDITSKHNDDNFRSVDMELEHLHPLE